MELSENNIKESTPLRDCEYYDPPTFAETVSAQIDAYKAAGMLESDLFNYVNEMSAEKDSVSSMDIDENSKKTFTRVMDTPRSVLQKLESLYEKGDIDRIRNWNEFGTGQDFLDLKEIQKKYGIKGPVEIEKSARDKAFKKFIDAHEVLTKSDSTSGKVVGAIAGFFNSPSNVATLPIGTWKAGSGFLMNGLRAFGEEASIEAGLQIASQPKIHEYKNEIGIKTSVQDSVVEALVNIGAAGTIRMTGSMAYDIGEAGIKALAKTDPNLVETYTILNSRNITDDFVEHVENMDKVELGESPVIRNPNEKAQEIMSQPNYKEFDDYKPNIDPERIAIPEELKMGVDESGNDIVIRYNDEIKVLDDNIKIYDDALDCLLGRK